MKYKGIELKEVTEQQLFDPPKKMLVWDSYSNVVELEVYARVSRKDFPVICENSTWQHCAEIPGPNLATYREVARWLAEGKGEMRRNEIDVFTDVSYDVSMAYDSVDDSILVRKWDDDKWHKPTMEYLGLEDK